MTKREVRRSFDKYEAMGSYHWDWGDPASSSFAPATDARYRVIAPRIRPGRPVLDIGCGDGFMMSLCRHRGQLVTGIDPELRAVELARLKLRDYGTLGPVLGGAESLPFIAGSFGTAVMADVIEHLREPAVCLREVTRVLEPDGRLLVTTPKWRPDRMWDPENHVREYKAAELAAELDPFFRSVELVFFVSGFWLAVRKRIGTVFTRFVARHLFNPFLRTGRRPDGFAHILAICDEPRA